jgi:hypothetical protein
MTQNLRVRRVRIALIFSAVLNGIFIVLDASGSADQYSDSRAARALEVLWKPSGKIAEWLAPAGHDAAHFLGGALIAIVSAVLFYALVVWLLLEIWARLNRQSSEESSDSAPFHP